MWLETKKARNFNAVVWVLGEVNGYPASVSSVGESLPLTAPTKERRRSAHPVAAIDIERLGHNVIAVRAGQEHRRRTVILRPPHAPERHRFPDLPLLPTDRRPSYLANSASTSSHMGVSTTPGAMELT